MADLNRDYAGPESVAVARWKALYNKAINHRLEPKEFKLEVHLIPVFQRLTPEKVSCIFLGPSEDNTYSIDMRIPLFIEILLTYEGEIRKPPVSCTGILRALLRYSSFQAFNIDSERKKLWTNSYSADANMMHMLEKKISAEMGVRKGPYTVEQLKEPLELLDVCTRWMDLITMAMGSRAQDMLGLGVHGDAQSMGSVGVALGTVVAAVLGSTRVHTVLQHGNVAKETRQKLSEALANFVPLLLQGSPQSAAKLEFFRTQTLPTLLPLNKKEQAAETEMNDLLDSAIGIGIESLMVPDVPIMNSRAGLYIYLSSLGDVQTTTIDLILASFDVLANATFRNEPVQTTNVLRSFLINKVPLLVKSLAASFFPPLTAEYCITEALSHVDTNAFPTLSSLFDESTSNNNMFSDSVRQDFCFSCCLHGLIPESSIETLLGDVPMQSLPTGGRYIKENLVEQYFSDPGQAEQLIDELEHMNGNVGAVSQAITEVIGRLCATKETQALMKLCSQLACKSLCLDVMLLFDRPTTILQPICHLLDNWHYDEDQAEYQPVYEEFGSILLLVLSFTHRYGLTINDLGIQSQDSFVAKLLHQGHLSRALDDGLTQQEQAHLDGWIRGLFDSEASGLGDELMSSCPPQDFYLLIPTLFHHIVLAFSTNNLSAEVLTSGLDYLVDAFLLPSLVPGITWMSAHLWESHGTNDTNAVLQILSTLITNPSSISTRTKAPQMLNCVLNIIAKDLERSLRLCQRNEPQRQDVEPLSKAIRDNLGWERRGGSAHTELESWTGAPGSGSGLLNSFRSTIQQLVAWGLNPGVNIMPAPYTHRQMLVGMKVLGAKRLLDPIIFEVKLHTGTGNGSVVIDIATALICAPDASTVDAPETMNLLDTNAPLPLQRRLSLREALKFEAENAMKIYKKDALNTLHAETVVRLHRKVEAQLAPQQDMLVHDDALADMAGVGGLGVMEGVMGVEEMGKIEQSMEEMVGDGELMGEFIGGGHGADLLDGFSGDMHF